MKRAIYWSLAALLFALPPLVALWMNTRATPIACSAVEDALKRFAASNRYETVVTRPSGQTKTLRIDKDIYVSEGTPWKRMTGTGWNVDPDRFGPILPVPVSGANDCLSYGIAQRDGREVLIVTYRGEPRVQLFPALVDRLSPSNGAPRQPATAIAPRNASTTPAPWQEIWIDSRERRPRLLKSSSGGFEAVFRYEELGRPEDAPGNISCEVAVQAIKNLMRAERYSLTMVQGSTESAEIVIGNRLYQKLDGRWRANDAALDKSRQAMAGLGNHQGSMICEKIDSKIIDGRPLTVVAFPDRDNHLWIDQNDGRLYRLSSPKRSLTVEYRYQNITAPQI